MFVKIKIANNQIEHETARALLVKLPGSQKKFWISQKLFNGNTISVNTDWTFRTSSGDDIFGEEIIDNFGVDIEDYNESYVKENRKEISDEEVKYAENRKLEESEKW